MKKILLLQTALCISLACATAQTATVTLDISKTYQKVTGFGSHGWVDDKTITLEPAFYRLVVDREYCGELEEAANDNSDPNVLDASKFNFKPEVIDWAKKVYAKPNAPFFIATVFSPPGWMKDMSVRTPQTLEWWSPCLTNPTQYKHLCGGKLKDDMHEEFAEWIVGWVQAWKKQTGKDLYSISIQNEPEFPEPYGSCVYTPAEMAKAGDVVAKKMKKEGLTTKMFFGEILWAQSNVLTFYKEATKYPDLLERIDAFALHNYDTDGIQVGGPSATQWSNTATFAGKYKKEMWMSETSGFSNDVEGLMKYCGNIYNAIVSGKINLWCILTNNNDEQEKLIWQAIKVTNKVKANSIRCDAVSSDATILSVGFTHFENQTLSTLLTNSEAKEKSVKLIGTILPDELEVYTTTIGKNAVLLGKLNKANDYTITLPGKSISLAIGKAAIPTAVSEENLAPSASFSLYPNPANNDVTANITHANVQTLIIYNQLGEQLAQYNLTGIEKEYLFNTSQLSSGIYNVHAQSGKQKFIQKLSIVK